MHHPYDAGLIDRAAQALFAGAAPTALLARFCGALVVKATARDWRRDRRRAPKSVLRRLRELAQRRAAECCELCRDLDKQLRGAMVNSSLVAGLWKFVSAMGREAYRATVGTDLGDRNAINSSSYMPCCPDILLCSASPNLEAARWHTRRWQRQSHYSPWLLRLGFLVLLLEPSVCESFRVRAHNLHRLGNWESLLGARIGNFDAVRSVDWR
jgi:hypothetical protein